MISWSSPYPSFHEVAQIIENWKGIISQYFLSREANIRLKIEHITGI